MIPAPVIGPALLLGRAEPVASHVACSTNGMIAALDEFDLTSPVRGTSRRADGLRPIDAAILLVRAQWPAVGAAAEPTWANVEPPVETLLRACASWLRRRRLFGFRVTAWRAAAITRLYWKVAWCYSSAYFVSQAWITIPINNGAGVPTSVRDPVLAGHNYGNPYDFAGSSYVHHAPPVLPARMIRGTKRAPGDIAAAGGFQGQHINDFSNYLPWFAGAANTDVVSVTTDENLAVNAATLPHILAGAPGAAPAWLGGLLGAAVPAGYVFSFDLAPVTGVGMAGVAWGVEHVYLAIPPACIHQWWVALTNHHTFGPFPYPAGGAAPVVPVGGVAPGLSAATYTLA